MWIAVDVDGVLLEEIILSGSDDSWQIKFL